MRMIVAAILALTVWAPQVGLAQSCRAPEPVCAAAASVFMISSFEPFGSAVAIGEGLLVTNRHMVADNDGAQVTLADGRVVPSRVVPTDYAGDLVLLEAPDVRNVSVLSTGAANTSSTLFNIGFDVGRQAVRVYSPGALIVAPASTPLARLHHDARSLPGNSGGALVDAEGRLVGIVASGGEGRNEAIPAAEIEKLIAASGPEKAGASAHIGAAYRVCTETLDAIRSIRGPLPSIESEKLSSSCLASNNRQLIDLAAQAFGMRRDTGSALRLLQIAHAQDPNAPNTLLSLAITYHLAGRYQEEIPIVRRGIEVLDDDPQLLRLALQAGVWGGDQALADEAMRRIEMTLPQMAPAARRFYDEAPPAPKLKSTGN